MNSRANIYQSRQLKVAKAAILFSCLILLALSIVSYYRIGEIVKASRQIQNISKSSLELQKFYTLLRQTEGVLNYYMLTADSAYLHEYQERRTAVVPSLKALDNLLHGTVFNDDMQRLDQLVMIRDQYLEASISTQRQAYDELLLNRKENNDAIARVMTDISRDLSIAGSQELARKETIEAATPLVLLAFQFAIVVILVLAYRSIIREFRDKQLLLNELDERNHSLNEKIDEVTRQKEFIEAIQNASFSLIAVYDLGGRFIALNKKSEEQFGISTADAYGKSFLEVFPGKSDSIAYRDLQRALKGEAVLSENYEAIQAGRYFQSYTMPVRDKTNALCGVVAVAHEVTQIVNVANELRRTNEALLIQKEFAETLLNASVDAICVFDVDLNFIEFNETASRIFGLTPKMKGRKITDLYPKVIGSKTHIGLLDAIEGKATIKLKHQSVIVDRTFESFIIPLMNQSGVYAIMLIHHDVTDFVAVTEELTEKNRELERSNAELEQFAFAASHDLQEPLRKIQTFASMLDEQVDSGRRKELTKKIHSSAARMSDLIRNVLDFSKVRLTEPQFEVVELDHLIGTLIEDLEIRSDARQVNVEVDALPVVRGSRVQLVQLFTNLIENALKFTERNPHIRITSEVVELEQKDFHKISVHDNGIGFEPQYKDHIFEVFKRLHSPHRFNGTGIGLAICKRIVSNHKGHISVSSEPGVGSVFSVFLPLDGALRIEPPMQSGHGPLQPATFE